MQVGESHRVLSEMKLISTFICSSENPSPKKMQLAGSAAFNSTNNANDVSHCFSTSSLCVALARHLAWSLEQRQRDLQSPMAIEKTRKWQLTLVRAQVKIRVCYCYWLRFGRGPKLWQLCWLNLLFPASHVFVKLDTLPFGWLVTFDVQKNWSFVGQSISSP